MALLLPADYPARTLLEGSGVPCLAPHTAAPRIGIINLMPTAQAYEPLLLGALGRGALPVEPLWLRLQTHCYASSDEAHLARFYQPAERVIESGTLDGLVVTGAPVEELPFRDVRYWSELSALLKLARRTVRSTLGICWAGMALAKLLGIEKQTFERKLFGVYPLRARHKAHPLLVGERESWCAQSRHAGLHEGELEAAEKASVVRLLAHSTRAGHTLFESHDGRYVCHLGHPEYTPARLCFEYLRDLRLGRADVTAPEGVALSNAPEQPLVHGTTFFEAWLRSLRTETTALPALRP